jgi:death-on-curing protein
MIIFLTIEQVIEIHDYYIAEFGGLSGVKHQGLLESAVEMPRMSAFGEFLHKDIYEMGAAYLFHLIQNHPFHDGNKRTAGMATIQFLESNRLELTFLDKDYIELVSNVAKGNLDKKQIADFFREFSI